MAPELPDTLAAYFSAQNDHDIERMLAAFAPDAEVLDEGSTHAGCEAIRRWKVATSRKYRVTTELLHVEQASDALKATVLVSGNFPGSPTELTYQFRLHPNGLIRRLEIR